MARVQFFLVVAVMFWSIGVVAQVPDTQWTTTYGTAGEERGSSIQETTDGGFIIAGRNGGGGFLIKTDAAGAEVWSQGYPQMSGDMKPSVRQATDGGYILAGNAGSTSMVIKVDADGRISWEKAFGETDGSFPVSIELTADGGYIFNSFSFVGMDISSYLVKFDTEGNIQWEKYFNMGTNAALGMSAQQTTDGGYILTGLDWGSDLGLFLIKTDPEGETVWSRVYGSSGEESGYCVRQTTDGGYIAVGETTSFGGGNFDAYMVRTDAVGDTLWTQTYGGSLADYGYDVRETADGGFVMTGLTGSFGAGGSDMFLFKVDDQGQALWSQTFGGGANDEGWSLDLTADGGIVAAGCTQSFGAGDWDFYVVRLAGSAVPVDDTAFLPLRPDMTRVYPNPFNPATIIEYSVPRQTSVDLSIFDLAGRRVCTLVSGSVETGSHQAVWSGLDETGDRVASGVYYCRLTAGRTVVNRKLTLLK